MEEQNYTKENIEQLLYEKRERLKELGAINETTNVLKTDKPLKEKLQQICNIIPLAWQYPENAVARIRFSGNEYVSKNFCETQWVQKKNFETIDDKEGFIEIFYLKEFSNLDEGPFMKEERHLINNLSVIISGYLNTLLGKELLKKIIKKMIVKKMILRINLI